MMMTVIMMMLALLSGVVYQFDIDGFIQKYSYLQARRHMMREVKYMLSFYRLQVER